jgi:D-alanyl-D-alanine carboxypeptidase (penicillin-binding protein 5/6)
MNLRRLWLGLALLVLAIALHSAGPAYAAPPKIDAESAIVVEPSTQTIVFAKRAGDRRQIASTTKMMTALIAVERASLDDVMVVAPYNAAPAESVAGFKAGERVTVRDLIKALMITSANDAAMTLAVRIAGSESAFVRLMNKRARSLGLKDTSFDNPIGLDGQDNYSTATDLVRLAFVLRKDQFLRDLVDESSVRLQSGSQPRAFVNRNTLVRTVSEVNGVKTGHTRKAGYLLVGSATRKGVTVLSVVMGEPSESARDRDTLALLRYGLARFKVVTAVRAGDRLTTIPLAFRGDESVNAVAAKTVRRTVDSPETLRVGVVDVPKLIDGPLRQGSRVGTVVVFDGDRVVSRTPLVTGSAVDAASFVDRLRTWLTRPLTLLLLAIFGASSLYVLRVSRKAERRRRARLSEQTTPSP